MKTTMICVWTVVAMFVATVSSSRYGIAQESRPVIKVVGLSVNLPDPTNKFGGSYVLGRREGIEVTVMVEDANAFFISVMDEGKEKTELQVSADGEKLTNESGFGGNAFMSNISDDGRRVVVPVSATQLPPEGTKSLKVAGRLFLKAGADEKKEMVKMKVAAGETVKLGPITTKISSVEDSNFGESMTNITFETNQSLDVISGLKFLDAQGKEIKSSATGSSSFGFGNQVTHSRGYQLQGQPKTLTVEVTYFGSTRTISIPVDMDVTLSLVAK